MTPSVATLLEGGAVGHLQHLYDNLSLTFGELKDVLARAAEGRLERASEKLDGMNLVFTYAARGDGLLVARSSGDIKRGGMDAASLAKKFYGRGDIEKAFTVAFGVLRDSLGALTADELADVFADGRRWYSMEIIYASLPNTINYDANSIVFHGWPVFELDDHGAVVEADRGEEGVRTLSGCIDRMQRAVSARDWRVRGPSLVAMKRIADGSVAERAIAAIDTAMKRAGVTDDSTVFDYLRSLMGREAAALGLPPQAIGPVIERAIGAPGAPGIPELKRMLPKDAAAAAVGFVKAADELKAHMMHPIEAAVHELSVEVLRGLESTLIARSDEEVERLRSQVRRAIKAIEASGHEGAMDVLRREMGRLGRVENVSAAMEGIVFFYKGQAYKFTGGFAPAHQILSLFKYGRKGIPRMDMGEGTLREGGHAVRGVGPIAFDDFRATWPRLVDDLTTLGCTDIRPIGSTGKKGTMGDIDVAAKFDGERDELLARARDLLGSAAATKVGPNIVSVVYPVYAAGGGLTDAHVQVDVMLGKPSYLAWSRFGTSPDRGHRDYSGVKGVVRNVLLNIINRFAADRVFPSEQGESRRSKYIIDFDRGLYKVVQGRSPRSGSGGDWKTIQRDLVSDDPDEIAEILFGEGTRAQDILRFEDLVGALRRGPMSDMAGEILRTFASEMRGIVARSPNVLGADAEGQLRYIDAVVEGGT